ncbi:hypothetical protein GCM10010365_75020 [Streptomyces poonensis]|uniref:Uncharacterized protein n=1 Tax=Streptomyces poonensis TaxID=68255 RepID=A0A918UY71_9ACTN|nr:hypothetical protein GCM10010365_75020 [Streptomyces poonensis]GLJ91713.1 hypothetical protein GCM10017589_43200 [Streptomyces poonensis]
MLDVQLVEQHSVRRAESAVPTAGSSGDGPTVVTQRPVWKVVRAAHTPMTAPTALTDIRADQDGGDRASDGRQPGTPPVLGPGTGAHPPTWAADAPVRSRRRAPRRSCRRHPPRRRGG